MLDEAKLRAEALGGLWTSLDVVASTGSTNADLLARAAADPAGPEGQVLIAEEQTAGRGRLGRTWTSEPGASLTFSVLVRPGPVPPARRGWLPLLAGVAVAEALRSAAGLDAVLKWPNDVLVGERKLTGILAEQSPDGAAVVIGIGVNVATPADALPASLAGLPSTSVLAEGAAVAREPLLAAILARLSGWYAAFRGDPDAERAGLLDAYRRLCGTLGRAVRVEVPAGRFVTGVAEEIDRDGNLIVREASGARRPISAGDVVHVRSAPGGPTMSLWFKTARSQQARNW